MKKLRIKVEGDYEGIEVTIEGKGDTNMRVPNTASTLGMQFYYSAEAPSEEDFETMLNLVGWNDVEGLRELLRAYNVEPHR